MKIYTYEQIIDCIWGAALMAGGGGGSLKSGLDLLDTYKTSHKLEPKDITLEVIDPQELTEQDYTGVTAAIGAPTAIKGDFTPYVDNAFALLQTLGAQAACPQRTIKYSLAVELGGFNTFVPMLIALEHKQIPLVDADGSGRAVPALNTTLLAINGNDVSPLALADKDNNQLVISLHDPKDAQLAETLARQATVGFGNICGLAGWMLRKDAVNNTLAVGSISRCQKIGAILRDCGITDKFGELQRLGIVVCREVFRGTISNGETKEEDGFDNGFVEYTADDKTTCTTLFKNETLVIQASTSEVWMTAPDIIACYEQESGQPLTNADLFDEKGQVKLNKPVVLGLIAVDSQWWNQGEAVMNTLWHEYFRSIGYSGDIKRF
ncbi:MAG: DUF917 domain-containing protein [Treponema sp.]|jgi:DUF917 family protein|nr:DUF917 domain-containing protein [Treponema sp.]